MKRALEESDEKKKYIYEVLPMDVMVHVILDWIALEESYNERSIYVLYLILASMYGKQTGLLCLTREVLPCLERLPRGTQAHEEVTIWCKSVKGLCLTPETHYKTKVLNTLQHVRKLTLVQDLIENCYPCEEFTSWTSLGELELVAKTPATYWQRFGSPQIYTASVGLMKQCTRLHTLVLSGLANLSESTFIHMGSALTKLSVLSLDKREWQPICNALANLPYLVNLRVLELAINTPLSVDVLRELTCLEKLVATFHVVRLGPDSFSMLTRLQTLAMTLKSVRGGQVHTGHCSGMLMCLTGLTKLDIIYLDESAGLGSTFSLSGLAMLTSLTLVQAKSCELGYFTYHNRAKPSLRHLKLVNYTLHGYSNPLTTLAFLAPTLTELELESDEIVSDSILLQMTRLVSLSLSVSTSIKDAFLRGMTHLRRLSISGDPYTITHAGVSCLTSLHELTISNVGKAITPSTLDNMTNLRRLHVHESPYNGRPFHTFITKELPLKRSRWPFLFHCKDELL